MQHILTVFHLYEIECPINQLCPLALYRDKLNYPTSVTAMVNSGIDVIFPEYLSTYSRKDEMKTDIGNTSMNYRDHLITWVKEVRYAVDYAIENGYEPHYFGVSWGGQVGVNILAIEKIRELVLQKTKA